jgi:hypothetical protein
MSAGEDDFSAASVYQKDPENALCGDPSGIKTTTGDVG